MDGPMSLAAERPARPATMATILESAIDLACRRATLNGNGEASRLQGNWPRPIKRSATLLASRWQRVPALEIGQGAHGLVDGTG